ncbi:MAG: NADH-quinone oxidoreductase subunit C, partial [Candidatus Asgardarchaeia archaeon]
REIHDVLGIDFKNHPNLERLILADDWPEGVYPLRKEYKHDIRPPSIPEKYEFKPETKGEKIIQVPIGPVHAAVD